MSKISLLCDVLDNQRNLTKWYLKKIPVDMLKERIGINGKSINSPLWNVAHLIWTDYNLGLFPLGYKEDVPDWINEVGFRSSGELSKGFPETDIVFDFFDKVHKAKLDFYKTLDDEVLNAPFSVPSFGFKSNYYALLHLARHEGIHAGGISAFCKFKGIKTI